MKWYIGKTRIGTPYFFPRKLVRYNKQEAIEATENAIAEDKFKGKLPYDKIFEHYSTCTKAVPLKVGFSSCDLGWKTKWTDKDIRFEWSPIYSFVFFGYQIALTIAAPDREYGHSYWEGWIYYELYTDKTKSKKERIEQCKKEFPMSWKGWNKVTGEEYVTNHYDYVLKKKYL